MKKTIIIMIGVILFISKGTNAKSIILSAKTSLTGKITDKKTGEALTGVSIYITDLKTGAISDESGKYKLDNLPQSLMLVQVSFVGYKLIAEKINLALVTSKDFELEESVAELNEVIITGQSQAAEKNRTATPITTVAKIQLLQLSATNIIDAIAKQPGISQVTTGSGISKPVIRGLGYNRVVVVNDGIRQEGQQWGDEHGIEVDEFSINKVEILKGPASLSYGSDAIAGVIHFISAPTLPDGNINGNLLANYQTNNGLIGYSANVAGNLNGLIWDVRYSDKKAYDYQNKYDGYVFNSGFRENNFGGIIGVNKSWGYSHLHFSIYNLTPGIVKGDRDSATGKFVKAVAINDSTDGSQIATQTDFKSYTPFTPYQKIHHYKAVLNNSFIIGNGSLKTTLGWQQNQRQEYGDILNENKYGLYFLLNTINYDVRYTMPEINNFNFSYGLNGMYQNSQNKGSEYLIPAYNLFDAGAFAIIKKAINKLDLSAGLRFDYRNEIGKSLYLDADGTSTANPDSNAYRQFASFNSTFTGVSGSIGATYQLTEKLFTKLNVARGYRAPNISEVGSNGVHDGTVRYEIGDPDLKPENSLEFDYSMGYNSEHLTAQVDLFSNNISNFIFSEKLSSNFGGDSTTDGYQTYKFVAGNALLTGGEFSIDIHPHPLDWLHFENTFSFVQSVQKNQPDSTKYLPFTPAPKFTSELKATSIKLSKSLNNAYFQFGIAYNFEQNKFYAANRTETATPGYLLMDIGFGTDLVSKKHTLFSIYFSINNLADFTYQSNMSRLKYTSENFVTGRTGIYNMGRNISCKVLVPISFKKAN